MDVDQNIISDDASLHRHSLGRINRDVAGRVDPGRGEGPVSSDENVARTCGVRAAGGSEDSSIRSSTSCSDVDWIGGGPDVAAYQ